MQHGWRLPPSFSNFTYGAPFMGLNLTSYYDGLLHVYAAGEEFYSSCDSCSWFSGSAPPLSGYVVGDAHNEENITGAPQYQVMTTYYFAGGQGWLSEQISAPNYDAYSPALVYEDSSPHSPRTVYVGGDGHIYQPWVDVPGTFAGEDIMAETGATPVALGQDDDALSSITGYFDGVNDHVFYIGVDQHVHELYMSNEYWGGAWSPNDLTLAAQATQYLPSMP
jgi:hypothetical protein